MVDGLRPCIPGIKPFAALAIPATVVPERGLAPCGTCYPCPGGEDHLKRRSSSPPVPPLLGCRHCSPVPRPNRHAPAGYWNATSTPLRKRQSPTSGTCLADSISAAWVQPRGCKGRSPLHKKTKNSPLPAGKGGRGDGGKKQAKGRASQCRRGQAPPLQAPQRQGLQVRPGSAQGCRGR